MNDVVEQIITRLLTERERFLRSEQANADLNHTLFHIRNLVDADSDSEVVEVLRARICAAEQDAEAIRRLVALEIAEVQVAVSRCVLAVGLTSSGSLRHDAENLARLLEAARAPLPGIL